MTRGPRAALWVGALALALGVLAADSARRLDGIERATDTPMGMRLEPEVDPSSPTGYRWGQHRLLLTQIDGYQWLLQAERAMQAGALRVRTADYDNVPGGREVHWAGATRWWTEGLAASYHLFHSDVSATRALERVAPWANALLLATLLVLLTPLCARALGALPAALFALGSVTVFPFYDFFGVGYLDHHGIAAMACVLAVLALVAGGGAWVRGASEPGGRAGDRGLWEALPTPRSARRWFAGAGLVAAVGLWISAASIVPVFVGIGIGALFAGLAARGAPPSPHWRLDAGLWRVWGVAAACGSFALFLLEYFPGDLGMRLEVNHPLYALALLGGGDLLARLVPLLAGGGTRAASLRSATGAAWMLADVALVAALPAAALLGGESTFRLTDDFLWILHDRYIVEFLDLAAWTITLAPPAILGGLSLVPLVALPLAAMLWPSGLDGGWSVAWRGLVAAIVCAAAAYAYVFVLGLTRGGAAPAIVGAVAVVGLWFVLPLSAAAPPLASPLRSVLAIGAAPALVVLLGSLAQMRWLGIASALWLGAMIVVAVVLLRSDHPLGRTRSGRILGGALAAAVLLPSPLVSMRGPFQPSRVDTVARDVSHWLRRRVGAQDASILAAPGPTTQMIWFGGFRGIGTLYWENVEGLRASRSIYAAAHPDSTRALLDRHGVTHVVFFGWDGGLEQLQLSAVASGIAAADAPGVLERVERDSRTNQLDSLPPWLVPLPYRPPTVAGYAHPVVKVFEVVDDLPPERGLAYLARFYQAFEDPRMEAALARSLGVAPNVPALAMMAQLQHVGAERDAFSSTLADLREELGRDGAVEAADRVEAAIALGLAGDGAAVSRQLEIVLAGADEKQLRRLSADRLALLVDLSRQLGLDRAHPETIALALRLLPSAPPGA